MINSRVMKLRVVQKTKPGSGLNIPIAERYEPSNQVSTSANKPAPSINAATIIIAV